MAAEAAKQLKRDAHEFHEGWKDASREHREQKSEQKSEQKK